MNPDAAIITFVSPTSEEEMHMRHTHVPSSSTSERHNESGAQHSSGHQQPSILASADRSRNYRFQQEDPVVSPSREESTNDREVTIDDDVVSTSSSMREQARYLKRRYSFITQKQLAFRPTVRRIINNTSIFGIERTLAFAYRWTQIIMVTVSTFLFVIVSMPQFYTPTMEIDFTQWDFDVELVVVVFFTIDFFLRIFVAETFREVLSLQTFSDLVSFLGFYIEVGLAETQSVPSNTTGFTLLRLLRLVRILRMLKLNRTDGGLQMLWKVLLKSKDGLFLLVVLTGIAVIVFAAVLYYIEITSCTFDDASMQWIRNDGVVTPFQSIPATFWFIAVTVTTVGYGDQVPGTLGGKAWTVVVMLFGVLLLSFPNILIGSNFSEVHQQLSRERARVQLGKYFRKVRVCVRFVRLWREYRIKGRINLIDDGGSNSPNDKAKEKNFAAISQRRMHNFLFRVADFPERNLLDVAAKAARGGLDQVMWNNISLLMVMQRLLECFSGCATVEELTQCFHFFLSAEVTKPPTIDSIFELVLRGAAAQVLSVFVLHREDESALVYLTKKGVDTVLTFPELSSFPCIRCFAEAKEIWTTTTRQPPFDFLPLDGYRNWQSVESRVPKRSPLDFCYDLKQSEGELNDIFKGLQVQEAPKKRESRCLCRYCNFLWGISAPVARTSDYCFEPDEEMLDMEVRYARNSLEIFKLERKLAELRSRESTSPGKQKSKPSVSPRGFATDNVAMSFEIAAPVSARSHHLRSELRPEGLTHLLVAEPTQMMDLRSGVFDASFSRPQRVADPAPPAEPLSPSMQRMIESIGGAVPVEGPTAHALVAVPSLPIAAAMNGNNFLPSTQKTFDVAADDVSSASGSIASPREDIAHEGALHSMVNHPMPPSPTQLQFFGATKEKRDSSGPHSSQSSQGPSGPLHATTSNTLCSV